MLFFAFVLGRRRDVEPKIERSVVNYIAGTIHVKLHVVVLLVPKNQHLDHAKFEVDVSQDNVYLLIEIVFQGNRPAPMESGDV